MSFEDDADDARTLMDTRRRFEEMAHQSGAMHFIGRMSPAQIEREHKLCLKYLNTDVYRV